jgi:hypothetical protein
MSNSLLPVSGARKEPVHCRPITKDCVGQVVDCLCRGFPHRERDYWIRALDAMAALPAIDDYPRYGYALEAEGRIVGVILLIYWKRPDTAQAGVRCNISSWCVDKAYRTSAFMLHLKAVSRREVTYLNISPANHTLQTIEAFGFQRFSDGQLLALPWLSDVEDNVHVRNFLALDAASAPLPEIELQILERHAAFGCRSILCVTDEGYYPFVFQRKMIFGFLPCAQLIYCRQLHEYIRFSGSLGRFLLFRLGPFCVVDTRGRLIGLAGTYFADRNPKYFKGPVVPRLGDLSFTELAVFGP